MNDSDGELLDRVTGVKDFFGSVFLRDSLDDWNLAKDMGEFLLRITHGEEIVGHALLARAYRHLGNTKLAVAEFTECQARVAVRKLEPWESQMIVPFLKEEARLLSASGTENP